MIERIIRWPVLTPIKNLTLDGIAFYAILILRFGSVTNTSITSDQGSQSEDLLSLLVGGYLKNRHIFIQKF